MRLSIDRQMCDLIKLRPSHFFRSHLCLYTHMWFDFPNCCMLLCFKNGHWTFMQGSEKKNEKKNAKPRKKICIPLTCNNVNYKNQCFYGLFIVLSKFQSRLLWVWGYLIHRSHVRSSTSFILLFRPRSLCSLKQDILPT